MADFSLTLGGVVFQDFEIPESIKAGGAQMLEIHKYAGGTRTIDASGSDDDSITWSGTFRDQDAESRCQQIDTMRKTGSSVALSWSSFSYQVLIKSFVFDYRKFYEIDYTVTLEVVQDNVQPATEEVEDPESVMQGDIDDANGFSDALADTGLTAAMGYVSNLVGQVASISGATIPVLNELSADVANAAGIAENLAAGADVVMDAAGASALFGSGANPLTITADLVNAASSADELTNAFCASSSLTRLGKNVAAVVSGG